MQNYKDLVLENEIGNIGMVRPIKGISMVQENPIGVLEKLGKYEFIYDYQIPSWATFALPSLSMYKGNTSNTYGNYNFDGDGTGGLKNIKWEALFPQPVKVNSEPQVGTFSKGNIVNVLRFDGNNAIIQNPNFVEPDPNSPKVGFFSSFGDLKKQKEFTVPKDYLRKVDDNLAVTVSTGILYGANMKPQPVIPIPPYKPMPQLSSDVILEENASFVLNQDYRYTQNIYCPPYARCVAPPQFTINSGTKVTGRLIRRNNNDSYTTPAGNITPNTYYTFLEAKGVGVDGSLNIPIEYLTRLGISNNLITDNNTIVTVISLVDKKRGKCNETGLIQTMDYNPCRVSAVKGQTYKGYISGGSFYSIDGEAFLAMNEYKIVEENSGSGNNKNNGVVVPAKDNNKNILMIVGAFLLGYVLFGKDTPTT